MSPHHHPESELGIPNSGGKLSIHAPFLLLLNQIKEIGTSCRWAWWRQMGRATEQVIFQTPDGFR